MWKTMNVHENTFPFERFPSKLVLNHRSKQLGNGLFFCLLAAVTDIVLGLGALFLLCVLLFP